MNKVSLNGIFSGKNKHECIKGNVGAAQHVKSSGQSVSNDDTHGE